MDYPNQPHAPGQFSAVAAQHPNAASPHIAYEMAPPGYAADADGDSGGILEYWRVLRRHKKLVLSFSAIGALLGIAICIPQKPVYQARTSLEVLSLNEDFMNMKQSSPTTPPNFKPRSNSSRAIHSLNSSSPSSTRKVPHSRSPRPRAPAGAPYFICPRPNTSAHAKRF